MPSLSMTVTGDTVLLAAPTAGHYRILGYQVQAEGNAGRSYLKSGSTVRATIAGTAAAGGGLTCPPTEIGYFGCDTGAALNFSQTTTGINVDINLQYSIYGN